MKFFFILKQTFSNLWRERTPVVATILTICIALTILVALFEISFVLYDQLRDLKSKMVIEVYLDPDATNDQVKSIQNKLETFNTIERLRFVSKETAAGIFKEEFGENIMDILNENPLPVSFEIRLLKEFNHQEYLSLFKTQVENLNGVDEVHYRHALIEKLENVTEAVAIGGIFVLIILVFAMNLLIRNTIKLSVYAKRRQIDIMKILGAGNLLIRMPFIFEGAIEGFIGGMFSAICLIFAHKFVAGTFHLLEIGTSTYKMLWVITISFGIGIGLITSSVSVGSFVNKIFSKK
ncbi:MAG: permease-like cell division protein FtsX [Candidatus Marinimicrobia bacterium]|nr:permease-like cell division protein FtsX [Candidatus Neomarinimicrobiota bacterium]